MNTLLAVLVPAALDKAPRPGRREAGLARVRRLPRPGASPSRFLWFSMRKQLRKVDFEEEPDQPEQTHPNGDTHAG